MTSNQRRAVALAEGVCAGRVDAASLEDADWHLLLLAAGTNRCRSLPLPLCRRVLSQAESRIGYFQTDGSPSAVPRQSPTTDAEAFVPGGRRHATAACEAAASRSSESNTVTPLDLWT